MMWELSYFLGLQISHLENGIFLSQNKYAKEILKNFHMEYCKPMGTPMITGSKLTKIDDSPNVDQTTYRSMIGSLLYLIVSRPDIMHVVCLVARFQSSPKESHVIELKIISNIFSWIMGFGFLNMMILDLLLILT